MRIAYVEIHQQDFGRQEGTSFIVSPAPFLYREDELIMPAGAKTYEAHSYEGLMTVLKAEFKIPESLLPAAYYFKPTQAELDNEESCIYRTVPKGAGEPEWRIRAQQALLNAVAEAGWSFRAGDGKVEVYGKCCHSIEELRHELKALAEEAGGKKRYKDEAYQPDYDVLVEEALQ